jgi:signal transduction histidine kinase
VADETRATRAPAALGRAIGKRAFEAAAPFVEASIALVIGVFSGAGETRFANRGMGRLLAGRDVRARLLSPSFGRLAAAAPIDPVFEGILSFGDLRGAAHSVRGRVRRLGADLLIVGEFDVVELERLNAEIAAANAEIAHLERRIELDKNALERALGELKETQAMLIHAEKMNALGKLTAGVAHEINHPVAFVASNARTLGDALRDVLGAYHDLEEAVRARGDGELRALAEALRRRLDLDFLEEDADELARGTLASLERVRRIVDGLRRFARLDEAEVQLADPRESLRDALAIAGPALRAARVEVSLDLADVPAVRCHPAGLGQVFVNLAVNAAQAIEARGGGGHLHVRTRAEPERVVIELEDDGAGMTTDVLGRIFEPFFTTKPVGRGTGIGLTIAHKIIVDRHGGTISATSTPGAGTTFTITLPREGRR